MAADRGKKERIEAFLSVWPRFRDKKPVPWEDVAEALNATGVPGHNVKPWTVTSARNFLLNNNTEIEPQEPVSKIHRDTKLPAPTPGGETLSELSQSYESGELAELLDWWRTSKSVPAPSSQVPQFRKDLKYKLTGIRAKDEILKRAKARLKETEVRTEYGESMSNLIEVLLFRFIGSPSDLLEGQPVEEEPKE